MFFIIIEVALWITLLIIEPISTIINLLLKLINLKINKEEIKMNDAKNGKGFCICGLLLMLL